jgi:hypothetical protein
MTNALYGKGRERFLKGEIDWLSDTFKVSLLSSAYTVAIDTHEFYSDLTGEVAVETFPLLSRTATLGVADGQNVTFSTVSGSTVESIVIWQQKSSDETSPLVAYIDDATNLPITPNGGDITVAWDSGAFRIFKL